MAETKNSTITPRQALLNIREKLIRAGAQVPLPITSEDPTIESVQRNGLSFALLVVETEMEKAGVRLPQAM